MPDSIVPDPHDLRAWSRYSYVYNNPIIYTDPTGHHPVLYGLAILAASLFDFSGGDTTPDGGGEAGIEPTWGNENVVNHGLDRVRLPDKLPGLHIKSPSKNLDGMDLEHPSKKRRSKSKDSLGGKDKIPGKASSLKVIKRGSKEWNDAVEDLSTQGKSKSIIEWKRRMTRKRF